jgi:hypothetical protein
MCDIPASPRRSVKADNGRESEEMVRLTWILFLLPFFFGSRTVGELGFIIN